MSPQDASLRKHEKNSDEKQSFYGNLNIKKKNQNFCILTAQKKGGMPVDIVNYLFCSQTFKINNFSFLCFIKKT